MTSLHKQISIAACAALLGGSIATLHADVKTDERALVKFEGMLGRMAGLFGGQAARDGVKSSVAVKGDRKISTNDRTGQIIDLAEERIYDLDIRKKTYRVTTFAELRRRMEEARRKAADDARKAEPRETRDDPARDPNAKEMEVDFSLKETGEKRAINGFDTRQIVMTIAMREKGKTIEESGGLVLTSDVWMASRIAAMSEVAAFDARYAKQLAGPMVAGASPEQMAAALAMYPGMQQALARLRAESVNLDGTPILTTTTLDAVKSAEALAQEQKQGDDSARSSGGGGLLGGLARRAAGGRREEAKPRATFMTMTNEVLKVATEVAATDVAVPAGYREDK